MDPSKECDQKRAVFVYCNEDGDVVEQDMQATVIDIDCLNLYEAPSSPQPERARMEEVIDLFESQFAGVCEELSISFDVQNEMCNTNVCLHTLRHIEQSDLARHRLNTIQRREIQRWISEFVQKTTIPPIILSHPFDFDTAFSHAADCLLIGAATRRVMLFNGICTRSLLRLEVADLVFVEELSTAQKHAFVAWAHHAAEVFQLQ